MKKNKKLMSLVAFVITLCVATLGTIIFKKYAPHHKNGILLVIALKEEINPNKIPKEFDVVYSGLGKINATLATLQGIQKFKPKLVVNIGTAGDVKGDLSGLYEIGSVIQRDMDAGKPAVRGETPNHLDETVISSGHKGLRCASGDTFLTTPDGWVKDRADVVEMELYAIALTCKRLNIPWRAFKYITDKADQHADAEWDKNFNKGEEGFLKLLPTLTP